jgi:hypothetical protein
VKGRLVLAAAAATAVVAVSGCGGDDEPEAEKTETGGAKAQTTERTRAETDGKPRRKGGGTPSPEDQPGGAGDEEPARSQALFTGRGGSVTPRRVRVPPYIAIRVELRSADGRSYALRFGDRTVRAGGELGSASTTFAGLRPGRSLKGQLVGGGGAVRIVADAEPGP